MAPEINIYQNTKKNVLVVPLDWGLGHTTRCIPIIKQLCQKGYCVILAGEKKQEIILKTEFPELEFIHIEGYNIRYGQSAVLTFFSIISQIPRIIFSLRKENRWLKNIIRKKNIALVISDNRFGLHHKEIPSVFITHQLAIQQPFGKLSGKIVQKINYRFINRFTQCWVPDWKEPGGLAGNLSHPFKTPRIPLTYTGPLSRFNFSTGQHETGHLLFLISGPEPQRSIFENIIIKEVATYNGRATVVRGLPGANTFIPSTGMIRFYNHLPADKLEEELNKASYIIGRCGYSTVMDIVSLKKRSILIPTPGQTEQEYLSGYLMKEKISYTVSQKNFSLDNCLAGAADFDYKYFDGSAGSSLLTRAIEQVSGLIN